MLIIVSGLPGSGKTYFASRLSEEMKATYLSSDLARKELVARGHYAFEDKLNAYEAMANRAGEELRKGRRVVVDATFYLKEMRELFITLVKLLHQKVAFIEVVADERIILERLRQPRAKGDADFAVYQLVKTQYENLDIGHLVIESKNDNIQDMLAKATQYISKFNEVS